MFKTNSSSGIFEYSRQYSNNPWMLEYVNIGICSRMVLLTFSFLPKNKKEKRPCSDIWVRRRVTKQGHVLPIFFTKDPLYFSSRKNLNKIWFLSQVPMNNLLKHIEIQRETNYKKIVRILWKTFQQKKRCLVCKKRIIGGFTPMKRKRT